MPHAKTFSRSLKIFKVSFFFSLHEKHFWGEGDKFQLSYDVVLKWYQILDCGAGRMAQVVECLSGKLEARSSNPSATKKTKQNKYWTWDIAQW
jgi:hypothetical protein